jgi:hypothetical protein
MLALSIWAMVRLDQRSEELQQRFLTPVPVVIVTPRP